MRSAVTSHPSVPCGYPTGILGPLARPVGNPCWVTMTERIAREQVYGTPRHLDSLLVRTAPGLRTLRSAAWGGASSDGRRSCLVCLAGGRILLCLPRSKRVLHRSQGNETARSRVLVCLSQTRGDSRENVCGQDRRPDVRPPGECGQSAASAARLGGSRASTSATRCAARGESAPHARRGSGSRLSAGTAWTSPRSPAR